MAAQDVHVDTRQLITITSLPASLPYLRTAGYSTVGDGGEALYKRVSTEPSHHGKVQSADGAWWEICDANSPLQFGARQEIGFDSRAAFADYIQYALQKNLPAMFPSGRYSVSSPVDTTDVAIICEPNFIVLNASGAPAVPFAKHHRWAALRLSDGNVSKNEKMAIQNGDHVETWNRHSIKDQGETPAQNHIVSWYDGNADGENAYKPGGLNSVSDVNYGFWSKQEGRRASGSHTLYTGRIEVHSAEAPGTGRTELVPLGLGINFHKDADVVGHTVNIYNDLVVSGPVSGEDSQREAFMAGISMLVQKFAPGNNLDVNHDGSYGLALTTRPQIGGWAPDNRNNPTYPLRAMLALSGYAGHPDRVHSGGDAQAIPAADAAILIGGEGGSQWVPHTARSQFTTGVEINDYNAYGLRIKNKSNHSVSWVYAIHVESDAGDVRLDSIRVMLPNLPHSPTGLTPGSLWRDGNTVKIV
ncbi:hypothetical protein [Brucella intermedia]|uniref:hypothetical protein n=1 Tax=Brucella intermedia TaxID=94625 RepID=UPI00235DD786|nr:hypothetical protein [Brucella intermedia]